MGTASPENYSLGRGILAFRELGADCARDLGNIPDFTISVTKNFLVHRTSRSANRTQDKKILLDTAVSCAITLEELDAENMAVLFQGTIATITQVASGTNVGAELLSTSGCWFETGLRDIGIFKIGISSATGAFEDNETVTGGTSGATGVVLRDIASEKLYINEITGVFQVSETITGGTSAKTAELTTGAVFDKSNIVLKNGSTHLIPGVDFIINHRSGRIFIKNNTATIEGTALIPTFAVLEKTYKKILSFTGGEKEGELFFISDNKCGAQIRILIHRGLLSAQGDTSFISGDNLMNIAATFDALDDSVSFPGEPFGWIEIDEVVTT